MKRYDLMHQINGRGTYLVSKYCIPHLKNSDNAHILNLAPPLDMKAKWFAPHLAYTMAKFTMSMCVLGMAEELKPFGIAVNALWPRTAVATAAVKNVLGGEEMMQGSRFPEIMADAAYEIFCKDSSTFTGNFCIDDLVLYDAGIRDFSQYAKPYSELFLDFFLPDDTPLPEEIKIADLEKQLIDFGKSFDKNISKIKPLKLEASGRQYFRAQSKQISYVLCHDDSTINGLDIFVKRAKELSTAGLRVPKVLKYDLNKCFGIFEDIGDDSLLDKQSFYNNEELVIKSLELLNLMHNAKFQNLHTTFEMGLESHSKNSQRFLQNFLKSRCIQNTRIYLKP